jgi:hypothetical protein
MHPLGHRHLKNANIQRYTTREMQNCGPFRYNRGRSDAPASNIISMQAPRSAALPPVAATTSSNGVAPFSVCAKKKKSRFDEWEQHNASRVAYLSVAQRICFRNK